jgi:FKBP-type peptidyl-prolyl cis-trans isomerase 2
VPVKKGDTVRLHYTGKLESGEEFDTSRGREPLTFEVGKGQLIPGIEEAVLGMEEGETKEVSISPEKGYGETKEELIREFPRSVLGPSQIQEGQIVQLQTNDGQIVSALVKKLTEDTVTFDFNHPLSGKVLQFELELVEIVR